MSGSLKGCAADVEVAAGLSLGRGFVAVVVWAVTGSAARMRECENAREVVGVALRLAARRRQRRQIIVDTVRTG